MVHEGLHENFNTGIWPECLATVNKLSNFMVNLHEEKYAYEKF